MCACVFANNEMKVNEKKNNCNIPKRFNTVYKLHKNDAWWWVGGWVDGWMENVSIKCASASKQNFHIGIKCA